MFWWVNQYGMWGGSICLPCWYKAVTFYFFPPIKFLPLMAKYQIGGWFVACAACHTVLDKENSCVTECFNQTCAAEWPLLAVFDLHWQWVHRWPLRKFLHDWQRQRGVHRKLLMRLLTSASNLANDDRGTSHTISHCISLPGEPGEEHEVAQETGRESVCVWVCLGWRGEERQLTFLWQHMQT